MANKFYDSDADADDKEVEDSKSSPKDKDSRSTSVNYEQKYKGLARKYTALEKEKAELEDQFSSMVEENAKLSTRARELEKAATSGNKEFVERAEKAEQKAAALELQLQVQSVSSKYPALADMLDDLKGPDKFENPEAYDAYLAKINDKLAPVQKTETKTEKPESIEQPVVPQNAFGPQFDRRTFLQGTTPVIPANTNSGGGSRTRSVEEITADMWKLDPKSKTHDQDYLTLEKELDTVLAQRH